ncbi:unnamed protein product, partial [Medioppia subpectinata]
MPRRGRTQSREDGLQKGPQIHGSKSGVKISSESGTKDLIQRFDCNTMSVIVVNDLWDELREENRWLRRRLRYQRHMYELLEDFRVNATDLLTECRCGKTGDRFAEILQEFERQLGYVMGTHWVPGLDDDHVVDTDDELVVTDNEELVSDDKTEVEVVDITSDNEEVAETDEGIGMTPPMVTRVADNHMDSNTNEDVTEEVVDNSVDSNDTWITGDNSLPIVGPSTARVMAINRDDNPSVADSMDKPMAEDVVTYLDANPDTDVVIDVSVGDMPSIVTPKKLVTTSGATHRPQSLTFDVHTYGSVDDPLDKPIEEMIVTYLDADPDTDVVIDVASAGDRPSTVTPKPVVTTTTATTRLTQNPTSVVRTDGSADEEFDEPMDEDFNLGTVLGDISATDWLSTVPIEFPSAVSTSTPKPQITGSATGATGVSRAATTPYGRQHRCRKCNQSFTNGPSLDRHVTLVHTKYVANAELLALAAKPYACHRCLYTTDRAVKLDKHLAEKHSAKLGPPPLTRVTPG